MYVEKPKQATQIKWISDRWNHFCFPKFNKIKPPYITQKNYKDSLTKFDISQQFI